MKVVPPFTYQDACDRAMDIESEDKTTSNKKRLSDGSSDEESEGESKTIQALCKDMMRMMKEMKGEEETKSGELW